MASKIINCAGCRNLIDSREYLKCYKCSKFYDIICASIPDKKTFVSMGKEQKTKWVCHECRSKLPKTGNTNTPVRNLKEDDDRMSSKTHVENLSIEHITTRKKQSSPLHTPRSLCSSPDRDNELVMAISDQVLKAIKTEIPMMISTVFKSELTTIKNDLLEFRQSMDFLSTMHDQMKQTIETLVKDNVLLLKENNAMKLTITELSDRLNSMEQHLRQNNLEIHGVPEHHNENLPNLLQQCARVVGYPLNESNIVKCTRVAKLNKENKSPRTIIVKFGTVKNRDELFSAVYRYNKSNPKEKLNTALLGIAGDKKPIYVSEHLSPLNKSLHAAARKKAKDLGYQFVWIKNSRIYVRKTTDSKYIHIKNNGSLDLIC